jgi:hypothetical protein
MEGTARTYKDKDSIGVSFPAFRHLLVFFLSPIEIQRKQSPGAVGEVGLFFRVQGLRTVRIWGELII